jgi:hypothetical protein
MFAASGDIVEPENRKEESCFGRVRQHAILSLISDIIMGVDGNKTYTWANQEGLKSIGEEVIGINGVIAEVRRSCVF